MHKYELRMKKTIEKKKISFWKKIYKIFNEHSKGGEMENINITAQMCFK